MTTYDIVLKEICHGCCKKRYCLMSHHLGIEIYLCQKCIADLRRAFVHGFDRLQKDKV